MQQLKNKFENINYPLFNLFLSKEEDSLEGRLDELTERLALNIKRIDELTASNIYKQMSHIDNLFVKVEYLEEENKFRMYKEITDKIDALDLKMRLVESESLEVF